MWMVLKHDIRRFNHGVRTGPSVEINRHVGGHRTADAGEKFKRHHIHPLARRQESAGAAGVTRQQGQKAVLAGGANPQTMDAHARGAKIAEDILGGRPPIGHPPATPGQLTKALPWPIEWVARFQH
jgi:hypothetical protein